MKNKPFFLFFVFCFLVPGSAIHADSPRTMPKNLILMIGDGMGFNQHIAGTYWRFGELGRQTYEKFPVHCGVTTFCTRSTEPIPPYFPGYNPSAFWAGMEGAFLPTELTEATDSTAAATALYTGVKTKVDRLSVDPNGKSLETIGTIAHRRGKSVGVVTTVQTWDATPGAVAAHNIDRYHADEILDEMIFQSPLKVIIGSGHPLRGRQIEKFQGQTEDHQKQPEYGDVGGETMWKKLQEGSANGFVLLETKDDFQKIAQAQGNVPQKIAGFPNVSQPIAPIDGLPDGVESDEVNRVFLEVIGDRPVEKTPTLSLMSLAAINVLRQNDQGFFVMIEGGAIDWACHARSPERTIMEQTAFAKAVDTVCDWVEKNSSWDETLVIVTADHETAQLWGSGTYFDKNNDRRFETLNDIFLEFQPIQNNGRGKIPGMQFGFTNHSNALVPLWAKGPGSSSFEKYIRGTDEKAGRFWNFSGRYIDNTDVFRVLKDCLE